MNDYVTKWFKDQKKTGKQASSYKSAKKFTWIGAFITLISITSGVFSYVDGIVKHTQYSWIVFMCVAIITLVIGIGIMWVVNDDLHVSKNMDEIINKNFSLKAPDKSSKIGTNTLSDKGTIASYIALNTLIKQDPNLVVDRLKADDTYGASDPTFTIEAHAADNARRFAPQLKVVSQKQMEPKMKTASIVIEGAKKETDKKED